mmetsp:Transcript_75614/g.208613  ORF Transcript_75614/g.208613 Transcript_75614/m.208613 type:complete len:264 (-) Transcript_75614:768-1559(-)
MSVVSSNRSSMFMRTVPCLVTTCSRLKVVCFSRGGSNAVFRSAKGSAICTRVSRVLGGIDAPLRSWPFENPAAEPCDCPKPAWDCVRCIPLVSATEVVRPAPGCCCDVDRPLPGRLPEASWPAAPCSASSAGVNAKFAVMGRALESVPVSPPRSKIFMSAFSILRMVTFSSTWNATSSGLVSRTCGCPVSCRKRQSARMTCVTSSAPLGGSLPLPSAPVTVCNRPWGTGAWAAATKPSLPWRSRRSKGISFLVFCRSMTAVMK